MPGGQFKDFNCVVSGSTLYAVWDIATTAWSPATPTALDSVTWPGGGTGVFLSFANGFTRLYKTSGAGTDPSETDTLTAGPDTCTVSSISTTNAAGIHINPPRFDDSPSQGAVSVGDDVMVDLASFAQFRVPVQTITLPDRLALSTSDFDTVSDAPCYINRDFTATEEFYLPRSGDRRVATGLRRNWTKVETNFSTGGWKDVVNDSVSGWESNWDDVSGAEVEWRTRAGIVEFHGRATASGAGGDLFTLPAGDRPGYNHNQIVAYSDGGNYDAGIVNISASTGVVSVIIPTTVGSGDFVEFSQIRFKAA